LLKVKLSIDRSEVAGAIPVSDIFLATSYATAMCAAARDITAEPPPSSNIQFLVTSHPIDNSQLVAKPFDNSFMFTKES